MDDSEQDDTLSGDEDEEVSDYWEDFVETGSLTLKLGQITEALIAYLQSKAKEIPVDRIDQFERTVLQLELKRQGESDNLSARKRNKLMLKLVEVLQLFKFQCISLCYYPGSTGASPDFALLKNFTQLTTCNALEFEHSMLLSEPVFSRFRSRWLDITELRLSIWGYSLCSLEYLSVVLKKLSNLERFVSEYMSCSDSIFAAFQHCRGLKLLRVGSVTTTPNTIKLITQFLNDHTLLSSLTFGARDSVLDWCDEGFLQSLSEHSSLSELSCVIGDSEERNHLSLRQLIPFIEECTNRSPMILKLLPDLEIDTDVNSNHSVTISRCRDVLDLLPSALLSGKTKRLSLESPRTVDAQTENRLCFTEESGPLLEAFRSKKCFVSKLDLQSIPLNKYGLTELIKCLKNYKHLEDLSVQLCDSGPIQLLCPKSRLRSFSLFIDATDYETFSLTVKPLVSLLSQQSSLSSLSCQLEFNVLENMENDFDALIIGLKQHPSLSSLSLGVNRGAFYLPNQEQVRDILLDIIQVNKRLKKLDVSKFPGSVMNWVSCFGVFTSLEVLRLPSARFDGLLRPVELRRAMKTQLSIEELNVFGNDEEDQELTSYLTRNKLLNRARKVADMKGDIPAPLLSPFLHLMVSHPQGESSALYWFIRSKVAMFSSFGPPRKRTRGN